MKKKQKLIGLYCRHCGKTIMKDEIDFDMVWKMMTKRGYPSYCEEKKKKTYLITDTF